ncbi:hypothetical protein J6590_044741 [Homalodisca vitripennis]|nr:hypothetical protein J6590_044741 [Homalodisca vitripennis]
MKKYPKDLILGFLDPRKISIDFGIESVYNLTLPQTPGIPINKKRSLSTDLFGSLQTDMDSKFQGHCTTWKANGAILNIGIEPTIAALCVKKTRLTLVKIIIEHSIVHLMRQ